MFLKINLASRVLRYLSPLFLRHLLLSWINFLSPNMEIENNVCTRVMNRFSAHERVILVLICKATREINTKITLEWAQKRFDMRAHTLFYFLHDITNP